MNQPKSFTGGVRSTVGPERSNCCNNWPLIRKPLYVDCDICAMYDCNENLLIPSGGDPRQFHLFPDIEGQYPPDVDADQTIEITPQYLWWNEDPPVTRHPLSSCLKVTIDGVNDNDNLGCYEGECLEINGIYYSTYLADLEGSRNQGILNYFYWTWEYEYGSRNDDVNRDVLGYASEDIGGVHPLSFITFGTDNSPTDKCGYTGAVVFMFLGGDNPNNRHEGLFDEGLQWRDADGNLSTQHVYRVSEDDTPPNIWLGIEFIGNTTTAPHASGGYYYDPKEGFSELIGDEFTSITSDFSICETQIFAKKIGTYNGDYFGFAGDQSSSGVYPFPYYCGSGINSVIDISEVYGSRGNHGDFDCRDIDVNLSQMDRITSWQSSGYNTGYGIYIPYDGYCSCDFSNVSIQIEGVDKSYAYEDYSVFTQPDFYTPSIHIIGSVVEHEDGRKIIPGYGIMTWDNQIGRFYVEEKIMDEVSTSQTFPIWDDETMPYGSMPSRIRLTVDNVANLSPSGEDNCSYCKDCDNLNDLHILVSSYNAGIDANTISTTRHAWTKEINPPICNHCPGGANIEDIAVYVFPEVGTRSDGESAYQTVVQAVIGNDTCNAVYERELGNWGPIPSDYEITKASSQIMHAPTPVDLSLLIGELTLVSHDDDYCTTDENDEDSTKCKIPETVYVEFPAPNSSKQAISYNDKVACRHIGPKREYEAIVTIPNDYSTTCDDFRQIEITEDTFSEVEGSDEDCRSQMYVGDATCQLGIRNIGCTIGLHNHETVDGIAYPNVDCAYEINKTFNEFVIKTKCLDYQAKNKPSWEYYREYIRFPRSPFLPMMLYEVYTHSCTNSAYDGIVSRGRWDSLVYNYYLAFGWTSGKWYSSYGLIDGAYYYDFYHNKIRQPKPKSGNIFWTYENDGLICDDDYYELSPYFMCEPSLENCSCNIEGLTNGTFALRVAPGRLLNDPSDFFTLGSSDSFFGLHFVKTGDGTIVDDPELDDNYLADSGGYCGYYTSFGDGQYFSNDYIECSWIYVEEDCNQATLMPGDEYSTCDELTGSSDLNEDCEPADPVPVDDDTCPHYGVDCNCGTSFLMLTMLDENDGIFSKSDYDNLPSQVRFKLTVYHACNSLNKDNLNADYDHSIARERRYMMYFYSDYFNLTSPSGCVRDYILDVRDLPDEITLYPEDNRNFFDDYEEDSSVNTTFLDGCPFYRGYFYHTVFPTLSFQEAI